MKTFTPTLVALLGLYEDAHAAGPLAPRQKLSVSASISLSSSCEALKDAGLTHIYTQDDEQYKARTESYWSVSAQLAPKCIVQPVSTEEVVTAIKTLGAENGSKFAVRSGGHTTWAGSNNINDGVTIDLGLMNETIYDESAKLAKIQPGNRWGGVYGALEPYGVTVAGGRASSVGVAGFLTGGGNTFFTAQRGFACDQVKNFEVVLSSGEVINANATSNSDLWLALKGGSSNFGIVTRFDMDAFEQGDLWGGSVIYSKNYTQQHIDAYVAWTDNVVNYPEGSSIIFWSYLPAMEDVVIIAAYEDTAGNVEPAGFDNFMAIPSMSSTMRVTSHKNLTDELEQATGYRDVWFTMNFKNDPKIFKHIVDAHQKFVDEWKAENTDHDFITQCMFQSIPTVFSEHSAERGGNVLGLDLVGENSIMLLFDIAVKGADTEARARTMLKKYTEELQAFAASEGGLVAWQYLNYADSYQNPLGNYGAENVARIRAAAKKYDPVGMFQTQSPGGFKISKVTDADAADREL
ncbi:fad binding domain-containing protein [Stemphylium lycopersici]|uniref:FAD-binding domain-containing protein n=1 Tax=Stemphylium lycopersici TaxID=183478 RepID=A0A364NG82_STELY|nr:fad binding domain-containing protein [Stemphylium lycopersici]RAR16308.1 FAD-binding domain-containing protein [Stemphylium lycopersici]